MSIGKAGGKKQLSNRHPTPVIQPEPRHTLRRKAGCIFQTTGVVRLVFATLITRGAAPGYYYLTPLGFYPCNLHKWHSQQFTEHS